MIVSRNGKVITSNQSSDDHNPYAIIHVSKPEEFEIEMVNSERVRVVLTKGNWCLMEFPDKVVCHCLNGVEIIEVQHTLCDRCKSYGNGRTEVQIREDPAYFRRLSMCADCLKQWHSLIQELFFEKDDDD